jgi:5-methylcytosine-specific restriction enzyme A
MAWRRNERPKRAAGGGPLLREPPSWGSKLPPLVKAPGKVPDLLYTSAAWRALVRALKAERGNYCVRCGAGGRGVRIIADHINEVKDGGAELDPANVQMLCMACHGKKTAQARRARRGVG